jgi:hypothetical protein
MVSRSSKTRAGSATIMQSTASMQSSRKRITPRQSSKTRAVRTSRKHSMASQSSETRAHTAMITQSTASMRSSKKHITGEPVKQDKGKYHQEHAEHCIHAELKEA